MQKQSPLFVLLLLLNVHTINAQFQGPQNPLSYNQQYLGCLTCPGSDWTDIQNVALPDMQFATSHLTVYPNCFGSCYFSRYLYTHNFGFNIPLTSVIVGVEVDVLRKSTAPSNVSDTLVQLYSGFPVGINHASNLAWTPNLMNVTYGSSTDLWGYTLTPDTINSPSFGALVMVSNKNLNTGLITVSIDNISITVYYNTATGLQSQTRTSSQIRLHYRKENKSLDMFSNTKQKIKSVTIFDLEGREIFSSPSFVLMQAANLSVPALQKGIYFASLNVNGILQKQKFFVE